MIQKTFFSLLILFAINTLWSQDLLESTLKGISRKKNDRINLVAQSVLQQAQFEPASLFRYAGNDLSEEDKEYLDQVIRINVDFTSLKSLEKKKSKTLRLRVPVSEDKGFHLLLEKVDILEPEYFMETSDGQIIYPDRNKIAFYRGIVDGNTNSMVSLTLVDNEVRLLISDDQGNYSISRDVKREGQWNLYNDKKLKKEKVFICGTHEGMNLGGSVGPHKGTYNKMMKNVPVYIEVENDIYRAKGSNMTAVEAHIMALMNASITSYANEQINISLSQTFIWTNPSPYNKNDLGIALTDFGARIKDNYNGRLAHYVSSAAIQGGTVGIAWTDVLCATYEPTQMSGPYGVTGDINSAGLPSFANNSQEVLTFVHELGHNFGSPHTHGCNWGPNNNQAIDNCEPVEDGPCSLVTNPTPAAELGTIMSYCNTADLSKGFGVEPGALIRNRYNAANCIENVACPTTLTVNTPIVNTNQLSSTSVSTSGIVVVNGAVVFSSANVNLNGGFEVPVGNCFEANNTGCNYNGVLNCDGGGPVANGTCNAPYMLTCGQIFIGNNATGVNNWVDHPVNDDGGGYTGKENVHIIQVPGNTTYVLNMTGLAVNQDLDLLLYDVCDNTNLITSSENFDPANSNETINIVNATANPVTYYVVVDGWEGSTSSYTLSCLQPG